jgi:hypothetical protein
MFYDPLRKRATISRSPPSLPGDLEVPGAMLLAVARERMEASLGTLCRIHRIVRKCLNADVHPLAPFAGGVRHRRSLRLPPGNRLPLSRSVRHDVGRGRSPGRLPLLKPGLLPKVSPDENRCRARRPARTPTHGHVIVSAGIPTGPNRASALSQPAAHDPISFPTVPDPGSGIPTQPVSDVSSAFHERPRHRSLPQAQVRRTPECCPIRTLIPSPSA